ncbi:MAG: hypothetical protein GY915_03135 [bacterium]|nr:hypothetical protein [bacterium]
MRLFIGLGTLLFTFAPFAYGQQGAVDTEDEVQHLVQEAIPNQTKAKFKNVGGKSEKVQRASNDTDEITLLASPEAARQEQRNKAFNKGTLIQRISATTPEKKAHRLKSGRTYLKLLAAGKRANRKFLQKHKKIEFLKKAKRDPFEKLFESQKKR